jgi:hypothetical protein
MCHIIDVINEGRIILTSPANARQFSLMTRLLLNNIDFKGISYI